MTQNALTLAESPASESTAILQVIERAAANPNVDIERMERLLAMQERILAKNAEQQFASALTDAQSKVVRVAPDASNPQTRSRYASYAALDRMLRPIYTEYGFALSFTTADAPHADYVRVVCLVSHRAGHTRTYHVDMPADGKGAKGGDVMTKTHAVGSAMSYGSRYLLKMIFNVAVGEDDDDGNAASGQPTLNEEQVANLSALLSEIGGDAKARFLRYAKVTSLDQILACNYAQAVKDIEKKRRAQS